MPHKVTLALAICSLFLTAEAFAKEHVLPDACGSDKITFTVSTAKPTGPLPAPAEGKAQIVFIQRFVKQGGSSLFSSTDFSTRFGMDGAWAGAAANNSYFATDVTPGEHHLCAAVQDLGGKRKDMIGVTSFTAEAGKTYYYEFGVERDIVGGAVIYTPHGPVRSSSTTFDSALTAVDNDQGKFRVKAFEVSMSSIKKP